MSAIIVKLKCISNLHVGSGDSNYNIIDNEVERDPVTNYPTINSSGVKGALREYFTANNISNEIINKIFGSGDSNGTLKFFSGDMLALAMRASSGNEPYHLVTTQCAVDKLKDNYKLFLNKDLDVSSIQKSCEVEAVKVDNAINLLDSELYLMNEDELRNISLPVTARNCLVEKKENLWYEEVVPHESIFTFVVYANDSDNDTLDTFVNNIDNKIIQFGANASIGCGFCKVTVVR